MRAWDRAGLQTEVRKAITVANPAPHIVVAPLGKNARWYFWETLRYEVRTTCLPIHRMRMVVEGSGRNRTVTWETHTWPGPGADGRRPVSYVVEWRWDTAWDDGRYAPPGAYPVRFEAWDAWGRKWMEFGELVVPVMSGPMPTVPVLPTATATPTAGVPTATATSLAGGFVPPTPLATAGPTAPLRPLGVVATATPAPTATPVEAHTGLVGEAPGWARSVFIGSLLGAGAGWLLVRRRASRRTWLLALFVGGALGGAIAALGRDLGGERPEDLLALLTPTPVSTPLRPRYDPYQVPFVEVSGRYGFQPVWVCPDLYDPACAANDVALAEFLVGTGLHQTWYGVVFSDTPQRRLTWREKVVLMTGTIDVGVYLERITGVEGARAFRQVYGVSVERPLVYHRCGPGRDAHCRFGKDYITVGMITQTPRRIGIASMWEGKRKQGDTVWFLFTRNNIVHELGHALDWRLENPDDRQATGRTLLDRWAERQPKGEVSLPCAAVEATCHRRWPYGRRECRVNGDEYPFCGFAAIGPDSPATPSKDYWRAWQQNTAALPEELFADMFLNDVRPGPIRIRTN